MKRRLEQFYNSFGDRGVMFLLYAFAVAVNVLPAVIAELPAVFPDEINVIGTAAMYSGRNWSGLLGGVSGGSGYVQALFYTPIFWVIKNPYAIYRAMLIVNSLIVGFIPLIVYHLSGKFGVMRVRRKLLIAMCCGMYVAYTINSKFVWNEPLTSLIGWLLVLCVFSAWDKSNRSSRAAMSALVGFLCAVAYAVNVRLISVVAAVVLTAVLARVLFRERLLNLPIFTITLASSFVAEYFLRMAIYQQLRGGTPAFGAADIEISANALNRFFGVFFSHIYAFMTSSVGLGALAVAIFVVVMYAYLAEGVKARAVTLEDGTKVYEPVKHKYSARLVVFALFQFLAVGATLLTSAFFTFGTSDFSGDMDIFGRYTDNIAPFAIFLVLVYIFLHGIDLTKTLIGAGIYGYSYICFAVAGYPLAQISDKYMYSSLFGLFPMIAGEELTGSSSMSSLIMSSLVFSLYAIVVVFVACARKNKTTLVTGTVFCVITAAIIYTGVGHIPRIYAENSRRLEPAREVMQLLYNDAQSPPIMVYDSEPEIAATIQLLAYDTRVFILERGGHVPENCLLIAENGIQPPFGGGTYDVVGRTGIYAVYAYGETARDFIRYSSANEQNDQTANSMQSVTSGG